MDKSNCGPASNGSGFDNGSASGARTNAAMDGATGIPAQDYPSGGDGGWGYGDGDDGMDLMPPPPSRDRYTYPATAGRYSASRSAAWDSGCGYGYGPPLSWPGGPLAGGSLQADCHYAAPAAIQDAVKNAMRSEFSRMENEARMNDLTSGVQSLRLHAAKTERRRRKRRATDRLDSTVSEAVAMASGPTTHRRGVQSPANGYARRTGSQGTCPNCAPSRVGAAAYTPGGVFDRNAGRSQEKLNVPTAVWLLPLIVAGVVAAAFVVWTVMGRKGTKSRGAPVPMAPYPAALYMAPSPGGGPVGGAPLQAIPAVAAVPVVTAGQTPQQPQVPLRIDPRFYESRQ